VVYQKQAAVPEEQADIYNQRIRDKFHDHPEVWDGMFIKPGEVEVYRGEWDIKLWNIE